MKYELVEQKFTDEKNGSWAADRADTITETILGEYADLGTAIRFRKFLVEEKKYSGDTPTGVLASSAIYIRAKAEDSPKKKDRKMAKLHFSGHVWAMDANKAMEMKAVLEAEMPGKVVLVCPDPEAGC